MKRRRPKFKKKRSSRSFSKGKGIRAPRIGFRM